MRTIAKALFGLAAIVALPAAAVADTLPRAFLDVWGGDAEACAYDGTDHGRYEVKRRMVVGAEHGWDIRSWRKRGDVWVGRGTAGDDQGSTPATIRLRLARDGRLWIDGNGPYIRCAKR